MSEPLENLYFNWLCAKVVNPDSYLPSSTYWELLKKMHKTEFVWLISGDDNRAEDGKELRKEFILQADIPDDVEWRTLIPCSVLEMFIAFARRAEFQTDIPAHEWFWEFLNNLGLNEFNDGSDIDPEEIDEILYQFIWRTYDEDGLGGMFPINNLPPDHLDQTKVEIWYQFCDYLVDKDHLP
jgi:hypothetical protein